MNLKILFKKILEHYGFVLKKYNSYDPALRCNLKSSLTIARKIGFKPATIIDVGAARGCWSEEIFDVWPSARYILIDPLEENESSLRFVCGKIKNSNYIIAALTDLSGKIQINVHPDLEGSSIFLEREDNINGIPRTIESLTLDDLLLRMPHEKPILLKADVQGSEMKVLQGAVASMPKIEMIILEVLFFDIYQGKAPQFSDVIGYLNTKGFVPWDIFGMGYRMLDEALCQADIVFVQENSIFRKLHQFASLEQRIQQLSDIQKNNPQRFKQS